jgi:hypothetical protein
MLSEAPYLIIIAVPIIGMIVIADGWLDAEFITSIGMIINNSPKVPMRLEGFFFIGCSLQSELT